MSQSFTFTVISDADLAEIKSQLRELRAILARHPEPAEVSRATRLAADGAMSIAAAAEFLGISKREVERLVAAGELIVARQGRRVVVSKVSAREYFAARLVVAGEATG
ncbi:MAG TPA: helix-turn-helix domain-containing protein [Urbifossiella sp.]|nr:helix-turn-helix domain-containing protein [Urbifossiella sp.]